MIDVPERPMFHGAFEIAAKYSISFYDAVYLDVAKRYAAALASRDARVLGIADAMNVPTFTLEKKNG